MFYELDFLNLLYSTIVLTHYVLSDPISMFSNSDLVRLINDTSLRTRLRSVTENETGRNGDGLKHCNLAN